MHKYYVNVIAKVCAHEPKIVPLWGPWAMLCINHKRALLIPHLDPNDFKLGWYCIVCTGNFYWKEMAYLCIDLGDEVIAFVLPPGIPLFLPSALFRHFNTWMRNAEGDRHSFVFWRPGSVPQWVELGYRTKASMSREEQREFMLKMRDFWQLSMSHFPEYSGS